MLENLIYFYSQSQWWFSAPSPGTLTLSTCTSSLLSCFYFFAPTFRETFKFPDNTPDKKVLHELDIRNEKIFRIEQLGSMNRRAVMVFEILLWEQDHLLSSTLLYAFIFVNFFKFVNWLECCSNHQFLIKRESESRIFSHLNSFHVVTSLMSWCECPVWCTLFVMFF